MISRVRSQLTAILMLAVFLALIILEYLRLLPGVSLCCLMLAAHRSVRWKVVIGLSVIRDVVLLLPLGASALGMICLRLVELYFNGSGKRGISIVCGTLILVLSNWLMMRHVDGLMLLIPCVYLVASLGLWIIDTQRRSIEALYESTT